MTVPGFPNLFMHYGPNSNPRAGTPPLWAEIQMRYICGMIEKMLLDGIASTSVRQTVFDEHNRTGDQILAQSVWMDPRQTSYYRNEHNRVATNSPWKTIDYWRWIRRPNLDDFELVLAD
jgi:4-hydroxyacetophenone monooxygenase